FAESDKVVRLHEVRDEFVVEAVHLIFEFVPEPLGVPAPAFFLSVGGFGQAAIEHFLGMTGTSDGRDFIGHSEKLMHAITQLVIDTDSNVSKKATLCLVNLSSDENLAAAFTKSAWSEEVLSHLIVNVVDPENKQADLACSVLSNLTRLSSCAQKLSEDVLENVEKIVEALCKPDFNKHADLQYLATFLMNMTQVPAVRHALLARPKGLLQQLLPCVSHSKFPIHRKGVVGIVKNCCFEYDVHEWLLSEEVDLLPRLLLPLAGVDDLEEQEMEQLPLDLQYLPESHTRDPDPEIRKMLVQALTKLCSTKAGRLYLKEKNAYIILRELHKWEREKDNIPVILNLIEILIGDEPQEGMEELHKVEVPVDLQEKIEAALSAADTT
ncbi:hypothetical protein BaRGS_00009592, partial [Batillaria attramentaria]